MASDLLKISLAVDNCQEFRQRVEIACALEVIECDRTVLIHIAKACVDAITLGEGNAVSTDAVTDDLIVQAVQRLAREATSTDEDEEGSE